MAAAIFNKIKIVLLILIWALIWRRGMKVLSAEAAGSNVAVRGFNRPIALSAVEGNANNDTDNERRTAKIDNEKTGFMKAATELPTVLLTLMSVNEMAMSKETLRLAQTTNTTTTSSSPVDVEARNVLLNATSNKTQIQDNEIVATEETTAADEQQLQADPPEVAVENEIGEEDELSVLQQRLIYEFAIKYKEIPRVTFLTCRSESLTDGNGDDDAATVHSNMKTMAILRRMYAPAHALGSDNFKSPAMAKTSGVTVTKIKNGSIIAAAATATALTKAKAASLAPAGNGNGNGNGKGNVVGADVDVAGTSNNSPAAANITTSNKNNNSSSTSGSNNNNNNSSTSSRNNNNNSKKDATATVTDKWTAGQTLPGGVLIKVVQIDQLINKRRSGNSNNKSRHSSAAAGFGLGGGGRSYGGGVAGGGIGGGAGSGRIAYTNANWLEQVLRSDMRRQIVVLNLSCGAASRRLLEMASNKALFNSSYHWLLIEDYVFNRQTGIDDNDSNANKNNEEVVNNGNGNDSTSDGNGDGNSDSDSDNKRVQASEQDIVGASTATNERQQQRQQQQEKAERFSNVGTGDASRNEDDMEIIEKFLEKINININTELILAKRHRRVDERGRRGSANVVAAALGNSKNISNNSLQKKDYYMLYDVWNPGLQYGGQLNISEIGYFALDDSLQIAPWYRRSTTITRRLDMKMARIRCLIVITHKNRTDTLEHYLTTHYDTHLDSMNRFNFALLSHVRDLFNFSFVLSKTSTWGYLKNGKFDGMIGALVRKQADIGGSPIFFRIERAKVIDYTSRTWVARPCFIFRHPRSTKKDRIVFLQPFSNDVWIFLGICGMFTILLLWLLTTLERRLEFADGLNCLHGKFGGKHINGAPRSASGEALSAASDAQLAEEVSKRYAMGCRGRLWRMGDALCGQTGEDVAQNRVGLFLESLLFYVGSICQQGLAFSTSFFSGRCIVITSLLFAFSIYQFYSASIVGTLLMEKPKTIRTLRDLIHSSLEIGIEDIVYNRDYFLRTKDPDAIELYAKKVTSVPMTGETFGETPGENGAAAAPPIAALPADMDAATKAKTYREILHSHETGAHAKTNEASNWYDPDYGVAKIKKGRFAFHVDVATAYKIIADTFTEKEICDLTEIQLFPPQKMVSIVQKGSPLRKIITYGLRRVTETGLMDYQRKVWHSPKPRCVKQIHTDDLRVDMQTFTSALLVLIFGYAVSLLVLGLEIMHHKLWQRYGDGAARA